MWKISIPKELFETNHKALVRLISERYSYTNAINYHHVTSYLPVFTASLKLPTSKYKTPREVKRNSATHQSQDEEVYHAAALCLTKNQCYTHLDNGICTGTNDGFMAISSVIDLILADFDLHLQLFATVLDCGRTHYHSHLLPYTNFFSPSDLPVSNPPS